MTSVPNNSVVFLSYNSVLLDTSVRQLIEDLRKRGLAAYAWPRSSDQDGRRLQSEISRHVNATIRLVIAVEPAKRERTGQRQEARSIAAFLTKIENRVHDVVVADLTGNGTAPDSLSRFRQLQLSEPDAVEAFALEIGGVDPKAVLNPTGEYAVVSGIFEVARSQAEMFAELKEQIKLGKIDQKYLYWDVRASMRWQKIAETSGYLTAQATMNLLLAHAGEIIDSFAGNGDRGLYTFINFGVGTGLKDYHILRQFLAQEDSEILYVPVDESLSMIQVTIQSIQELIATQGRRLHIQFVLDDFANVEKFMEHIEHEEMLQFGENRPTNRLIALLGGSLGNFRESDVLLDIRKLLRAPTDQLLLGVEFIANQTDVELLANYSDFPMKEFLYGPILDAEGISPNWENDFQSVIATDRSAVPAAKTIVGQVYYNRSHFVEMFQSTKYRREELEEYLRTHGFQIRASFFSDDDPPRFGKYLLAVK